MAQAVRNDLRQFLAPANGQAENVRHEIDAILAAVRDHLGMEIAFASRFVEGRREFTHIQATVPVPASPGDSEPLEETLCQRILEGRLPALMHDAQDHEAALEMTLTRALPIGAHLNVPIRFRDGRIYGTFCCLSRSADRSLTERDLMTVKAFAQLASDQIERDLEQDERRDQIRHRIKAILGGTSLGMVYQPIHSLEDGRVRGLESLARFPAVEGVSDCPSDWFAAAAEVGLGQDLELHAIRHALAILPTLPSDIYLSINASPETAVSGRLDPLLAGLPRQRLVIEITEHSEVTDYALLEEALNRLRPLARIAIDDVGAGYAGLRHIVDLHPDLLKLDMSLTRHVDSDPARGALAQAMVDFAGRIGCAIVAEGVETAEEADTLRGFGVGYVQGYLYNRPAPAVVIQQLLLDHRPLPTRSPARRPGRRAAA